VTVYGQNLMAADRVDHRLYGVELPVHGWHHLRGEIHLLLTLPDGSRGYVPAAATALLDKHDGEGSALTLNAASVHQLPELVEALNMRTGRHCGVDGRRSK
jgi:hypothetical protein